MHEPKLTEEHIDELYEVVLSGLDYIFQEALEIPGSPVGEEGEENYLDLVREIIITEAKTR